jgi:hypothetical protein
MNVELTTTVVSRVELEDDENLLLARLLRLAFTVCPVNTAEESFALRLFNALTAHIESVPGAYDGTLEDDVLDYLREREEGNDANEKTRELENAVIDRIRKGL